MKSYLCTLSNGRGYLTNARDKFAAASEAEKQTGFHCASVRETVRDDWTSAPDASRKLTAALPLRVIAGRGLVDACGRLILNAHARRSVDDSGNACEASESDGALSPTQADANAHAVAHALNNAPRLADALRALRAACENASTLGRFADGIGDELDALENAHAALDALTGSQS
jgi:hypothetical protein